MRKLVLMVGLALFSQIAFASRYDAKCNIPYYRVNYEMYGNGPVWVSSWLLQDGAQRDGVNRCTSGWDLLIGYLGDMAVDPTCDAGSFRAGVKLNGRGFYEFPMAETSMHGKRAFQLRLVQPSKVRESVGGSYAGQMEDLFFWAFDQTGHLNNWDVEVYVKATCGGRTHYDSRYGQNYRVTIAPR